MHNLYFPCLYDAKVFLEEILALSPKSTSLFSVCMASRLIFAPYLVKVNQGATLFVHDLIFLVGFGGKDAGRPGRFGLPFGAGVGVGFGVANLGST